MSLIQALFETINTVWSQQGEEELSYLTTVHIHPSLARAIETCGEELPKEFDPNIFNFGEKGNYFEIGIEVSDQDELIYYEYR